MSENYYTSLLQHLQHLMDHQEIEAAKQIVEEELSMPFVPKDVLKKLQDYQSQIDQMISKEKPFRLMSPQEVYECFQAQNEKTYQALEVLSKSNIRVYLEVIQEILLDDKMAYLWKALLIEQLSLQQVTNLMQYTKNGQVFHIIPSAILPALSQENVGKVQKRLEELIADNPSFLAQCQMVLVQVCYQRYPQQILDEAIDLVSYSIIRYVYAAYGDEQGFQQFKKVHQIDENQLEQYGF